MICLICQFFFVFRNDSYYLSDSSKLCDEDKSWFLMQINDLYIVEVFAYGEILYQPSILFNFSNLLIMLPSGHLFGKVMIWNL